MCRCAVSIGEKRESAFRDTVSRERHGRMPKALLFFFLDSSGRSDSRVQSLPGSRRTGTSRFTRLPP